MQEIIFFGNGPLATHALEILKPHFDIIFHAKTRTDLATVKEIKTTHPSALAILASFGVIIKPDLLDLFEPTGILNLHPSLLPKYRGPSPIETAILSGDTTFGISIMKLVKAMDAGPIYYQTTLDFDSSTPKSTIYEQLARTGAKWLVENINSLPTPIPQDDTKATFCKMLDTSMSPLDPSHQTASTLANQIRAFQGFPKSKFTFFGHDCTILSAQVVKNLPDQIKPAPSSSLIYYTKKSLFLSCAPDQSSQSHAPDQSSQSHAPNQSPQPHNLNHSSHPTYLEILTLQPAGKKPMPAPAFLNGYAL